MTPGKAYGRSEMYQEKTERLLFLKAALKAWDVRMWALALSGYIGSAQAIPMAGREGFSFLPFSEQQQWDHWDKASPIASPHFLYGSHPCQGTFCSLPLPISTTDVLSDFIKPSAIGMTFSQSLSWRWMCFGRVLTLIMKCFVRQSMLKAHFTTVWLHFPLHQI